MTKPILRLRCACGWEVAGDEGEVVAATEEHGRRLHNMAASREAILAMVIRDDGSSERPPDPAAEPGGGLSGLEGGRPGLG